MIWKTTKYVPSIYDKEMLVKLENGTFRVWKLIKSKDNIHFPRWVDENGELHSYNEVIAWQRIRQVPGEVLKGELDPMTHSYTHMSERFLNEVSSNAPYKDLLDYLEHNIDYIIGNLNMFWDSLDTYDQLSPRTVNLLKRNGINCLTKLKETGIEEVKKIKGLGAKAIEEIEGLLNEIH